MSNAITSFPIIMNDKFTRNTYRRKHIFTKLRQSGGADRANYNRNHDTQPICFLPILSLFQDENSFKKGLFGLHLLKKAKTENQRSNSQRKHYNIILRKNINFICKFVKDKSTILSNFFRQNAF